MTAKEFLQRYRTADDKIAMLTAEINKIELQAEGGGQNMDGQPHGTGKSDKVASAAVKAADLKADLEAWKFEQEQIKREVLNVLGQIDDFTKFTVLKLRYIEKRPAEEWQNIADVMDKSVRQVQRIHGFALLDIERILDAEWR